jgi:hypothetical protein
VPNLSDKMLAERLKELEAEGMIRRTVIPETPVRVEYELTDKGRSLNGVPAQTATNVLVAVLYCEPFGSIHGPETSFFTLGSRPLIRFPPTSDKGTCGGSSNASYIRNASRTTPITGAGAPCIL